MILFCDNLSAHLDQEVKTLFGNGKVLLFYFPPNMTNFIQPIDAGLGRSVRILIGHFLHAWLMEADHMEKWESKMTVGERRILSRQRSKQELMIMRTTVNWRWKMRETMVIMMIMIQITVKKLMIIQRCKIDSNKK